MHVFRRKTAKIPSPPRDPRRAAGPDDNGVKVGGPSKQQLSKRRQDLDPAEVNVPTPSRGGGDALYDERDPLRD